MGDVGSHEKITSFVRDQLQEQLRPGTIESREYTFLELGNFLTDVSQFRDPPAFHNARESVVEQVLDRFPLFIPIIGPILGWLFGTNSWVEVVFGQAAPGKRHGALATYFRHVIFAATHQIFATDGFDKNELEAIEKVRRERGDFAADLLKHETYAQFPFDPIPPADVDRVFEKFLTQYWPHEHLDFPPVTDLRRVREKRIFQRGRRGLIRYLEWNIQFISEELSKLELDWIRELNSSGSQANRQELLVRMGNLLHPIEDFFYHSNFVELRQWRKLEARHQDADLSTENGRRQLAEDGMNGTGLDTSSNKFRRILYRRLRFPRYQDRAELSDEESDAAFNLLSTGGFGKTDIFHTLGGALESLGAKAAIARRLGNLQDSEMILIRLLFNRQERTKMVREELEEDHQDLHKEQLTSRKLHNAIRQMRAENKISPRAEQELIKAMDLDLKVEDEYWAFPGLGGLLILILSELETERLKSEAKQKELDKRNVVFDERSDNGASIENIGTHSLMSKDSNDKEPLRVDATALAQHASASVAALLLNRVANNRNVQQGLDWDTLLRFYMTYPKRRPGAWYEFLLDAVHQNPARFQQPDTNSISSQPNFGLLGPHLDPQKLAQRRRGDTRQKLEEYYRRFEK